jgi:hypothetical protein
MFWPQDLTDLLGGGTDTFGGLSRDDFWAQRTADPQNPRTFQYSWFMDSSCKLVSQKNERPICGFASASWSPISLIWTEGTNVKEDMTVVEFPLSPDRDQRFSLWQASDSAPLLVYDPHESGKVASAKQLFGNLAFGGITQTPNDFDTPGLRAPWENGYQALALLDSDRNGKIEGIELKHLALWFDRNRNAIVEDGEMQTIQEVGISALFFKDPEKSGSEDMMMKLGFERKSNGKLIKGSSIDWFAHVFSSRKEAADSFGIVDKVSSPEEVQSFKPNPLTQANPIALEPWMRKAATFAPKRPRDISSDTTGYWAWWIDNDPVSKEHPGILALEQGPDGKIKGFSVVESILKPNSGNFKTVVQALPAVGEYSKPGREDARVRLSVIDGFGKATGVSSAILSSNGMTLTGRTAQKTQFERDKKASSAMINYSWTAKRLFYKTAN